MSKRQFIMILGILVLLFPFLRFPPNWNMVIAIVIGLLITATAYVSGK